MENFVLGPLLGLIGGFLDDVVPLLEQVVRLFLRPGGLPRVLPRLLLVDGDIGGGSVSGF